jgi:hypothetical protein
MTFEQEFHKQYNKLQGQQMYPDETTSLEQAQVFWQARSMVLRARSEALAIAMLGKTAADSWWQSQNRAFEDQTPDNYWATSPERVYGYLMSHADGGYW